ncbi:hypothetical protein, partial [Streptomyces bottropensis]|uniref:hypothetical protein n=1 Tax=Streptomyces bottropensis TaxID=42235 RepID=UPI0036A73B42
MGPSPAVVSWGPDRLDVFALGDGNDILHRAWQGDKWWPEGGWESLDALVTSPPAVASWGPDRLDVFALGAIGGEFPTSRGMNHLAWQGDKWWPEDGWQGVGFGELFTSPPAVVSWGPERLDIFALGEDRQMLHRAWHVNNKWWPEDGWHDMGGRFTSPPAVASWGPGRLDVFALGENQQMLHKAWHIDGKWWPDSPDWHDMGGRFTSPPAVASWGPGRLDVFALGANQQ